MVGDILQPTHLLFVLVVALLVLGPKRLPEVGRSLGRTMRDFRSALSGHETYDQPITETVPQPTPPATQTGPAAGTQAEPPTEPGASPAGEPGEEATAERQPTHAP